MRSRVELVENYIWQKFLPGISLSLRKAKSPDMNSACGRNSAFTLIEILLVSALATFLLGMGVFSSVSFYRSYVFRTEESLLVSVLERARGLAQNNVSESAHGVHFDSDNYVIFRGVKYDEKDSMNELVPKNPSVNILGAEDILFAQLSGAVDISEEKKMTITDGIKQSDISINHEGRISY